MRITSLKWPLFIVLSFIWGSSFLLMFIALNTNVNDKTVSVLSPYQVAAIRIVSSAIVLLPFSFKALKQVSKKDYLQLFLVGFLGNLLPAILFCMAEDEERISTALAGSLNSITPVFVILVGILFYNKKLITYQIVGVAIALLGAFGLLLSGNQPVSVNNWMGVAFIITATICYGFNVNQVGNNLKHILPTHLAALSLLFNAIPACIILLFTDWSVFSAMPKQTLISIAAASTLGIFSTAFASILFYKLMQISSAVFASLVTYGIPIVAVFVSAIYFNKKELFNLTQFLFMFCLLLGVYIANGGFNKTKSS